jgi:hypothetical protein
VITRVGIQKALEVAPSGEVHDLVDSQKRERVLWACLVQARVAYTHSPLPTLFGHENYIVC